MHPYTEDWVAIGNAFLYYDRAAHALSAEIKRRHCSYPCVHAYDLQM